MAFTTSTPRRRIVIAGAGIAGSILAAGLRRAPEQFEVIHLEKAGREDQLDVGTGLNIGPNGVKTLRAYWPTTATALEAVSLPWRAWTIALTSGETLMRLALDAVADTPGLRMRWSDLYKTLRAPINDGIRYGHEVIAARVAAAGRDGPLDVDVIDHATGARRTIEDVDLVAAMDGRFSRLRAALYPDSPVRQLGVANFRVLVPAAAAPAIDDYVQYFCGPHRLLAFRVPGDALYISGSFPVARGATPSKAQKTPEALRALFVPRDGRMDPTCRALTDAVATPGQPIHWSRFHDEPALFHDALRRIVLLGDAAHPIVPTLGQGATQTIEDACVAQEELRAHEDIAEAVEAIVARRAARIAAVAALSWDSSDGMLPGADPRVAGPAKGETAFLDRLATVYRETPTPKNNLGSISL